MNEFVEIIVEKGYLPFVIEYEKTIGGSCEKCFEDVVQRQWHSKGLVSSQVLHQNRISPNIAKTADTAIADPRQLSFWDKFWFARPDVIF